jgi:hypothetical protein
MFFIKVWILYILRFITICDLFTKFPSYYIILLYELFLLCMLNFYKIILIWNQTKLYYKYYVVNIRHSITTSHIPRILPCYSSRRWNQCHLCHGVQSDGSKWPIASIWYIFHLQHDPNGTKKFSVSPFWHLQSYIIKCSIAYNTFWDKLYFTKLLLSFCCIQLQQFLWAESDVLSSFITLLKPATWCTAVCHPKTHNRFLSDVFGFLHYFALNIFTCLWLRD